MLIIVQDLSTGGGERIIKDFLSKTSRSIRLYSSEQCKSKNVESIIISNWSSIGLLWLAFKVLLFTNRNRPICVVLTKPIIIFGVLNIFFRRNLYLYEHCDPFLLYFQRPGIFNKFKSILLSLAFKKNRIIVVTEIVKNNLIEKLYLCSSKVNVLPNPSTKITESLVNIRVEDQSSKSIFLIIGRYSPEKRFEEAINYYHKCIKNASNELWIVSKLTDNLEGVDHIFADFEALNDYVLLNDIVYKPTLINFSISESYSLVIAEFLASGLPVLSVYSPTLDSLWSPYLGFQTIGSEISSNVWQTRFQPNTYEDFENNLLRIIE